MNWHYKILMIDGMAEEGFIPQYINLHTTQEVEEWLLRLYGTSMSRIVEIRKVQECLC